MYDKVELQKFRAIGLSPKEIKDMEKEYKKLSEYLQQLIAENWRLNRELEKYINVEAKQ